MSSLTQIQKIKKSVTFLYTKTTDQNYEVIGTGFFIGVNIIKDVSEVYCVTAKHVLIKGNNNKFDQIYFRLNMKNGKSEYVPISLTGYSKLFTHNDTDVDIALFRCTPNPTIYDYSYLHEEIIPTNDHLSERHVAEGTLVGMVGLFNPYVGNQQDQPFFRYGRISLIPTEKVPIYEENEASEKLINAYFCEFLSFSGNSGSPTFFIFERVDDKGRIRSDEPDVFLGGIVKGHYPDIIKQGLMESKKGIYYQLNAGISIVTPSYILKEILYNEQLTTDRKLIYEKLTDNTLDKYHLDTQ